MNQPSDEPKTRPWPVTALSFLLLLQALGLFGLGLLRLNELHLNWQVPIDVLIFQLFNNLLTSSIFIPLALLGLWATIGFLRLWSSAWLNAMLLQGLSLVVALILYFRQQPGYVYVMMLYSIFMVIYLHYPDVQVTFHIKPGPGEQESD